MTTCPYCFGDFHRLGIMSHRKHCPNRVRRVPARLELGRHGVQAAVIKVYEACGCTVDRTQQSYRRGQHRNPGTPGLPDLYVWPPVGNPLARNHAPWWHETKADDGKQSKAQKGFQARCEARGVEYIPGGVPEAIAQLQRRGFTL